MAGVIGFIFFLFTSLLQILSFLIIASAILSWLVAFDVVNLRNRFVYSVASFLESIVRPVLYPLRRMIPPLGGMDITPIIALLIIQGMQIYLIPTAAAGLMALVGG